MADLTSTKVYGDLEVTGTITGQLSGNAATATNATNAQVATKVVGVTAVGTDLYELVRGQMATNDIFRIAISGTAVDSGYVEIATSDNGNEPIYVRQYSGGFTTLTRTATILDASGNTSFPGTVTASAFSGNASTATKLQTARTINGVSFDGSANITVADSTKLPLAGGTLTGDIEISKTAPRIRLFDNDSATGTFGSIEWDSGNTQGVSLQFNEFDNELPVAGYGLVLGPSSTNSQFPGTGVLSLNVLGEIYAGGTTLPTVKKVLHAGNYNDYAPTKTGTGASGTWSISVSGNAATATKLATARTISLTGDLTGSASFDGSANVSITAAVVDDSHNHSISTVTGLQAALDAKFPRRSLYVNQQNVAETRFYKIAQINANSGSVHIRGNIGGHDLTAQGAASVGISVFSRNGTVQVQGYVTGSLGAQDLLVYKDASNVVSVYVETTVYALVDLQYSETNGATIYTDPSYTTTAPTDTLVWAASANHGGTNSAMNIQGGLLIAGNIALDSANFNTYAPTKTGTGASGTWGISVSGNSATATKLATARTISVTGDGTGSASFDGSANASISLALANSGVTAGTYPKVTVDAKGRVTAGASLAAADIPNLDASKITSGTIPDARLSGTYTNVSIDGQAGRLGYAFSASSTGSTYAGQFVKFATVTLSAQYNDCDLHFLISANSHGSGDAKYSRLTLRVKQQAAFGSDPYVTINHHVDANDNLEFGYVIVGNAGPTVVDFYVKNSTSHCTTRGFLIGVANAGGSYTLLSNQAFSASVAGIVMGTQNLSYHSGNIGSASIAATQITGILPDANLSGTYTGVSITGNAATATKLATARTISLTGDVTGSASFDGSANISITATVADDSHNHTIANVDGLQTALDGKAAASHTHDYLPLAGGTVTGAITNSGAINAVKQSGEIGGTYASWNVDRQFAIQLDCANNAVAYGGIRWTKWGERHLGAIDCYAGGTGSSAPRIDFHVGSSTNAFAFLQGGNFTAAGNITAYSDVRLKTDIQVIPEALSKVEKLRGVTYTRIETGERQTGVIAQEVQEVLPEAVMAGTNDEKHLTVAYGNMVGLLIEAVKELSARVKELEGRA